YGFINRKLYQRNRDSFSNSLSIHMEQLENYLSNDDDMKRSFQDVNALYFWLIESDFIKDEVATDKILATKAIQI
ncbi:TPA: hypothetical protein ACHVKA_003080, partial [Yersinia enterocolitica]